MVSGDAIAAMRASVALIDAAELASLVHRSLKSVRVDSIRRPETLPPRYIIPGTRKLLWRLEDVKEWMDEISIVEAERLRIEQQRRNGVPRDGTSWRSTRWPSFRRSAVGRPPRWLSARLAVGSRPVRPSAAVV
ncbi:hypothetical protein [Aquabacterium humicola]|uniref:hypothetical protein n=1 Tax=Aquabacterium humicola TaxID=3237377 RepID=UPI002543786C|nr:hypothetical protein [Rubrivivax pictus]